MRTPSPSLSVIIPVYAEAATILPLLEHLLSLPYDGRVEIIVADGEPTQTTRQTIERIFPAGSTSAAVSTGAEKAPAPAGSEDAPVFTSTRGTGAGLTSGTSNSCSAYAQGADDASRSATSCCSSSAPFAERRDFTHFPSHRTVTVISSPSGRARQMNAGAASAMGDGLIFLHADTRLPRDGLISVARALFGWPDSLTAEGRARREAGAFGLSMDTASPLLRFLVRAADFRNRLFRTPYGDQAQFFRADTFREIGGYADIPLMEDVEIMRRLRDSGRPIRILSRRIQTSPRRYEAEGMWRCALRNLCLRTLYALGVPPQPLARWYRAQKKATRKA